MAMTEPEADRTQLADTLMEDDPGIYQDLLDERDEAMQRLEAAQRSEREMHIAAERLRATTNRYFDVLERQQAEVFGADARELIDAMEQSTVGTRELADARDAVFVLLGRPKDG